MREPKQLTQWDFPDTELVPDGYDMTCIPKMSDANFRLLIAEHNNLVEVVNLLCSKTNAVNFLDFDYGE